MRGGWPLINRCPLISFDGRTASECPFQLGRVFCVCRRGEREERLMTHYHSPGRSSSLISTSPGASSAHALEAEEAAARTTRNRSWTTSSLQSLFGRFGLIGRAPLHDKRFGGKEPVLVLQSRGIVYAMATLTAGQRDIKREGGDTSHQHGVSSLLAKRPPIVTRWRRRRRVTKIGVKPELPINFPHSIP